MSYTPMTEEVRGDYAHFQCPVGLPDCTDVFRVALAEFDRWLAALIREAKAEALTEAVEMIYEEEHAFVDKIWGTVVPKLTIIEALRVRAAEYRKAVEL